MDHTTEATAVTQPPLSSPMADAFNNHRRHHHHHHDETDAADAVSSSSPLLGVSPSCKSISLTTTMLEGAKLMREQDAELLESMRFTDSCSTGGTPPLLPMNAPSIHELPLMSLSELESGGGSGLAGGCGGGAGMSSSTTSSTATISRCLSPCSAAAGAGAGAGAANRRECSSSKLIKQTSTLPRCESFTYDELDEGCDFGQPFTRDDSQSHSALSDDGTSPCGTGELLTNGGSNSAVLYRQCLSGEVRVTVDEPDVTDHTERSMLVVEEGAATSPISVTQEVIAARSSGGPRGEARIVRSKSMDRRMSEAFQFAEAVGEMPPLDQPDLCIIEEGGSDDDDDDDGNAKEIRIDHDETNCRRDSGKRVSTKSYFKQLQGEGGTGGRVDIVTHKNRPQWPFQPIQPNFFLFQLPDGVSPPDFAYKGICANPPEITMRGISRGNYAQLHRKAWLEVSDKYHRYGKNLRLYYRHWEEIGFPTNSFFDWLDSKGEAAGQPLPNLDECPRCQLDSDTVLYIANPDVTHGYSINIVPDDKGRGLVLDVDGERVRTGSEGWIFVLRDNVLYGALKITSISGHSKQRFHHSSFFGGKAVAAAGIIFTDDQGHLIRFYPHSGHYRPGEAHVQRMLFFLHHKGVDLRTFDVDTQQILHVSREDVVPSSNNNNNSSNNNKNNNSSKANDAGTGIAVSDALIEKSVEKKKKKVDSLYLKPAVYVACFLAHKARFIGEGVFAVIHKIRKANVTTVTEALDAVDEGGFWKQRRSISDYPSL